MIKPTQRKIIELKHFLAKQFLFLSLVLQTHNIKYSNGYFSKVNCEVTIKRTTIEEINVRVKEGSESLSILMKVGLKVK